MRIDLTRLAHAAARMKGIDRSVLDHRLAARRGKKRAIVAVAHTFMVSAVYRCIRDAPNRELGGHDCDPCRQALLVDQLTRRMVYTREGALLPGSAVHEAGGAPMGADPTTSVLNPHNQLWDAPNVFVTDSAAFPTSPFQNPGLSIMALSARAGHFIADALARGAL